LFFVMSGAGAGSTTDLGIKRRRSGNGSRIYARFQDGRPVPSPAHGSEGGAWLRRRRMAPKPAHGSEAGARLRHRRTAPRPAGTYAPL